MPGGATIAAQASGMLAPPIHNFGIKDIRLAAKRIPEWPGLMTVEESRQALFNVFIFIRPVGGSGGGLFRYMFSRFLIQAATILGNEHLDCLGAAFQQIGDAWESVSDRASPIRSPGWQNADRSCGKLPIRNKPPGKPWPVKENKNDCAPGLAA